FDPLGRMVAFDGRARNTNVVSILDAADRRVTAQTSFGQNFGLMGMGFSPDGNRVAVATADWSRYATPSQISPRWVVLIDPSTGRKMQSLRVGTFDFHVELGTSDGRHFTSLAYLPSGRLAVSWFSGGTTIWDPHSR